RDELRGRAVSRAPGRQRRRVALGPLGGDDDGMGEPLGPAVVAEDLVGPRAARPLDGDLQELVLQALLGQARALQPRTGLDDLLDVQLEDVAPSELGLGPLAAAEEHAEPAPALLERELDLLPD